MDTTLARLRSLIAWEDTFLALVALAVVPVLNAAQGGTGSGGRSVGPITGLFVLVAIGGIIACLFTRGPDEPPPLGEGKGLTFQGWVRFPLAAGVSIVAIDTLPSIGLPSGAGGLVFLAVVVSVFAHRWLPVIPVATRRLLVLPMGMVGAGAFDRIIGSNLSQIMGLVTQSPKNDPMRGFLPLILGAVLMVYVMLVVAPRSIADPEARGWPWIVRFGLLLAAAALGNTVVGRVISWLG
jgi:hypothetical protein